MYALRFVASVELMPDAAVKPELTTQELPGQVPVLNAGRVLPEKVIEGVTLTPPGCPR